MDTQKNESLLDKEEDKQSAKAKMKRSEMKKKVAQFILRHKSGEGFKRLGDIGVILQKDPLLKDELISEIHNYVTTKYPLADKMNVDADPENIERLLACISVKDFVQKKYESYPFLLKNNDFYRMMGLITEI